MNFFILNTCTLANRMELLGEVSHHTYLTSQPFLSVVSCTRHISRVRHELGKTTQL